MRHLAMVCVTSLLLLNISCTNKQIDSTKVLADSQTTTKQKQVNALLKRTSGINIPDLETKHPGKVFTIEWKVESGTVSQISLRRHNPQFESFAKTFGGLKAAITKLPKGSSVSYIYADDRLDLLSNGQFLELRDLCMKNGMVFYLHKGG